MNKAIEGARVKGALARREGKPESANPYWADHRTHNGSVTFARAFMRAWLDGWRTADTDLAAGCDCQMPYVVSGAAGFSQDCPVHGESR
jgi:hypothetical protein